MNTGCRVVSRILAVLAAGIAIVTAGAGQYVNIRDFGAIGDGRGDDGPAMANAILAAGTNGVVYFPPGAVYLTWRELVPLEGQTLSGYGAVLKRGGRRTATLVGPFAFDGSPSQSVQVDNAAAFAVGMSVSLFAGSYPTQLFATANMSILSITGNSLEIISPGTNSYGNPNVTNQFPAGAFLATSLSVVVTGAPRVKVMGLEIDGNAAENGYDFTRWEIHSDIHLGGDGSLVRDCFLHDSQSEGIAIGGTGSAVESCRILRAGGNGIHLSGARAVNILNNVIKTTNLAGSRPGHEDGNISFSENYGKIVVSGNHLEDGLAGIGGGNLSSYDQLVVANNTFTNFSFLCFEGVFQAGVARVVSFSGNQFYNAGMVRLNLSGSAVITNSGHQGFSFLGNHLVNTTVFLDNVISGLISDNHFACAAGQVPVYVQESKGLILSKNVIVGGAIGILAAGSADSLSIQGNLFRNQDVVAIWTTDGMKGIAIRDNSIVAEAGMTSATFAGIWPGSGHLVMGNHLTLAQGSVGIGCQGGGNGVPGAIVTQNVVRVPPGTLSIQTYGGSQNNSIIGNFVTTPVANSGGSTNLVSGNVTIY